jgi:DNA-binding transcriptional LysR family regulator
MTSSHGLRGPTFRVLQKVCFDRSLPPLQAILCFRTMSAESQLEAKRVGAVIYLATNRPLHLPDFLAEFHRSWPHLLLQKTGKEPHRALFRVGKSDFALELHHTPVPQEVTEPVVHTALHWPMASAALAHHKAYLSVVESAENRDVLTLACDLTKAVASLLPVTDSLAVCWLNGPALNSSESFVSAAREMFGTGLYPLKLWVAVGWDAQAGALQTNGMAQFAAPEICLAQQPDAAPLMVNYLFQVAQSALTSHHQIAHGETMDSPHGKLKIKKSTARGKSVLILEPDTGR